MRRSALSQSNQAPEELVGAVSSCGHVDLLEERFASWIGQQDRSFPSQSSSALLSDLRDSQPEDLQPRRVWAQFHEWLEDWSRARCDEVSQWSVLVTDPPGTRRTAGVRLLARHVRGTFLECDMREVEGRKLVDGCHLEHRHGCDGRVEVEVVQGSPTVADPAYLRLR